MRTYIQQIKPVLALIFLLCALTGRSQCTIDFTYTHTDSLYQFTNTSSPLDTGAGIVTWSVHGPGGITYQSTAEQPSFFFPVNGAYTVYLQVYGNVPCGGYKLDTITVSGLIPQGDCHARMDYYPTSGTQFEFLDTSIASDSIVNYSWYGYTPDSFIQVAGWTQNTVLNMWSYNRCAYPHYIVHHTITTLTGCQSTVTDTVKTYCSTCLGVTIPTVYLGYDSIDQQYYLADSGGWTRPGPVYWQISVDDTVIFSQYMVPYLSGFDTLHQVCLNLYDTIYRCTAAVCDSFGTSISPPVSTTGIATVAASGPQLHTYVSAGSRLVITYTGSLPAHSGIYDIEGRLLLSPELTGRQTSVDLSNFASGSYIIRASSPSQPDMYGRFYIAR